MFDHFAQLEKVEGGSADGDAADEDGGKGKAAASRREGEEERGSKRKKEDNDDEDEEAPQGVDEEEEGYMDPDDDYNVVRRLQHLPCSHACMHVSAVCTSMRMHWKGRACMWSWLRQCPLSPAAYDVVAIWLCRGKRLMMTRATRMV